MGGTQEPQYNRIGVDYNAITELPCNKLEQELISMALGDCTGFKILDLAGGTGLKAVQAIDAGAVSVDVVDISSAMAEVAEAHQKHLNESKGRIRAHVADCSKPLAEQGLSNLEPASFDIVMGNWLFEYAGSVENLTAMWTNITTYLKPGGKFLGIRVTDNFDADYMQEGKYGAIITASERTTKGCKYRIRFKTDPQVEFDCAATHESMSMDETIPRGLGLGDFLIVDPKSTKVVRGNQEFWEAFITKPCYKVVTARKRS